MTTNIKQREIQYQRTPLPIETAFTMDDIAYNITKDENGNFIQQPIIDKDKFNRYYFNYPAEWKTSDTGEPIVGLRSIWIHKKKRKLEFQLCIRKYTKADMLKQLQVNVPRYQNITSLEQLINNPPTDDEIEIAVSKIPMVRYLLVIYPLNVISIHMMISLNFGKMLKNISKHTLSKSIKRLILKTVNGICGSLTDPNLYK